MKIIGNKIKELVIERKLTDAAFARLIGTARSYPPKLYLQNSVSTATLEKISKVLKVPLSYWFENETPEAINSMVAEPEEDTYGNSPLVLMKTLTAQNEILIAQNKLLLKSRE